VPLLKTLLKLFKNRFLDQITRSMIEDFKAGRAKEFKKGNKTQLVSPATVNRSPSNPPGKYKLSQRRFRTSTFYRL